MSFDEKESKNKVRFSREITLGDLILAIGLGLPLVVAAIHLSDRVDDHEKRLGVVEQQQVTQDTEIIHNQRDVAVLQSQIARHYQ